MLKAAPINATSAFHLSEERVSIRRFIRFWKPARYQLDLYQHPHRSALLLLHPPFINRILDAHIAADGMAGHEA